MSDVPTVESIRREFGEHAAVSVSVMLAAARAEAFTEGYEAGQHSVGARRVRNALSAHDALIAAGWSAPDPDSGSEHCARCCGRC